MLRFLLLRFLPRRFLPIFTVLEVIWVIRWLHRNYSGQRPQSAPARVDQRR